MDYIKELMNVGDDVLRTVTYAIENNDFSHLSEDLKARFSDFAAEVKQEAEPLCSEYVAFAVHP